MIADTHIHIWDLQRVEYGWLKGNTSILNRSYTLDELEAERTAAGITMGVLVQAANNLEDTELMLESARSREWIKGVVGWLPLQDPDAVQQIWEERFATEPYFKGVRHLIHDEADPQWLLQPAVIESLSFLAQKNIPYDVVGVLPEHLETVLEVAEKVPALRLVLDHLNQPPLNEFINTSRWAELMKEAARHPQVYAKISGLGTTSGKPTWGQDMVPAILFVKDHFGAQRCFLGGDWPVSLLADGYAATWKNYKDVIGTFNETEQEQMRYQNAQRFYAL